MTDKLYVSVIGVGHLGSKHAKVYSTLKGAHLVGVCDISEELGQKVAKKYRTTYYSDYHDLFDKVQAVSIAVPTFAHYKIAKECLLAGLHVLIEKPITKTLDEADELLDIARKKKLTIQVGHIERFNSAVLAVDPHISKPKFIECSRLGPFVERAGDIGVVMDLMIHDIDIILSLIPSKVDTIEAMGIRAVSDHEDTANVRITFANKAIADLTASRMAKKPQRTIKIFQENSYILLDYITQTAELFKKGEDDLEKIRIRVKKDEPLKKELESFVHCVKTQSRPIVSGEEARRALNVAIQITEKIRSKLNEETNPSSRG